MSKNTALTTALATLLATSSAIASQACAWPQPLVSSQAKAVSLKSIQSLPAQLTGAEIVRRLGPAHRDVGSGVYVLQWEVANGQVFLVSVASACALPLHTGLVAKGKT